MINSKRRATLQKFINGLDLNHALEWYMLEDKYIYCLDLYGLSADDKLAEWFGEQMEKHFLYKLYLTGMFDKV